MMTFGRVGGPQFMRRDDGSVESIEIVRTEVDSSSDGVVHAHVDDEINSNAQIARPFDESVA